MKLEFKEFSAEWLIDRRAESKSEFDWYCDSCKVGIFDQEVHESSGWDPLCPLNCRTILTSPTPSSKQF